MQIKRIPFMLIPLSSAQGIGSRFRGVGVRILAFYPSVRYDLRSLGLELPPENYCTIAFFSAMIWSILVSFVIAMMIFIAGATLPLPVKILVPFLALFVFSLLVLVVHLAYPKIISGGISAKVDRELIFAMRDMLIQISSGVPFFTVVENIGASNYEYLSDEFKDVANKVKAGSPLLDEIENMAIRTQSEYLKKTSWQLVTAIRTGANLTTTLKSIVKVLVDYQFSLSKSFNAELNFIILVYLMISAVLPTIGTTVLVIFSVFGMLGITSEVFMGIIFMSFFGQMGIIAYVNSKRPNLFT
ncbi:Type II secretion system (T2SS), protein F [uncultured archaeon]|nr:Type II secretion system (T2SS), protein F [uncultured archaeon]